MPQDVIANEARFGRNPTFRLSTFQNSVVSSWVDTSTNPNNPANFLAGQAEDSLNGPNYVNFKCRGTVEAPTDPVTDDHVSGWVGYAYSGGTWFDVGTMFHRVDGAFVSGQRPPSRWEFHANVANAAPALRMVIKGSGNVGIGNFDPATGVNPDSLLHVGSNSAAAMRIGQASANSNAPVLYGRKSRGTMAAPATVADGDELLYVQGEAYTNAFHDNTGAIRIAVDGTVTAGQRPPSAIELRTNVSNAGGPTTYLKVNPNGTVAMGTGAQQTQATVTAQALGSLWVALSTAGTSMAAQLAEASASGVNISIRKSRGSLTAPATVNNADDIGSINTSAYTNQWHNDLARITFSIAAAPVAGQNPATSMNFYTNDTNAAPVSAMSIGPTGTVRIGNTGAETTRKLHVIGSTAGTSPARMDNNAGGGTAHVLHLKGGDNATTGSLFLNFIRPDNTQIGSVSQNAAGTVAYNTSSDARLKENVTDMDAGLPLILALRPRRFSFITDPSKQLLRGFLAQELHAILPEMVTVGSEKTCACGIGEQDADGNICTQHEKDCCHTSPWGVDYGKLTPILVKAVQELAARVTALGG